MQWSPQVIDLSSQLAHALGADVPALRQAVAHTAELDRVMRLPRRAWDENDPYVQQLVRDLTVYLRAPGGTQTLRAVQAMALSELFYVRGLFGPIRVGAGKTAILFLAATLLGAERPVLVVPAKLRKKTQRDFTQYAYHWRAPPALRIVSYEELSRDYGKHTDTATGEVVEMGLLDYANPDLLMFDEVHRVKNTKAACTRKVSRFMRTHPQVPVVALSGTITKRSLRDYAHVLVWCLKNGAPLPRGHEAMEEWCHALDVKVRDDKRLAVGALAELATPEERLTLDPLTAARRGYRRRLIETPGVVAYSKQYDGSSLYIDWTEPKYNDATEKAFYDLRTSCVLPDTLSVSPENAGDAMGGMLLWRHARELALGFYYTYDPFPPMPWVDARREWHAAVRNVLAHNQRGFDSEGQIAKACLLEYPGDLWKRTRAAYARWVAIKDTSPHRTVTRWIDDGPIHHVAEWMSKHKGIVWVEQKEFGFALQRLTGAPYFGEQGIDAPSGMFIDDARPDKQGSIIASIKSNTEGRNLQLHWWKNLVTSPTTGGDDTEQLLGRTQREGQDSDEVEATYVIGCKEQLTAWFQARADSVYGVDSAHQSAMILSCDQDMPDENDLASWSSKSARWW